MQIVNGFLDLQVSEAESVVTIGNFDGMHLGHHKLFEAARARAFSLDRPLVAVTFDPHPLKVLRPDHAPKMILSRRQKIERIRAEKADRLVFIRFNRTVAAFEAPRFVDEFLVGRLRARALFLGQDFRFGHDRTGDLALLQSMAADCGFDVASVETVLHEGERISASRIRATLESGDVAGAAAMLGRPWEATGEVVHGSGRGRTESAPTANIRVENEIVPPSGVYITEARVEGEWKPSLTNIGTRPTFEDAGFAVETWLPDFSGDLYGEMLRVRFHRRLRDEKKFEGPKELRAQIVLDLKAMRAFFSE